MTHQRPHAETTGRRSRELVARDKNHPCVVMWSIANEPNGSEEGAREYFAALVDLTRELDPTRPVGFVNVMFATPDKDLLADLFDVICSTATTAGTSTNGDLETAERNSRRSCASGKQVRASPSS